VDAEYPADGQRRALHIRHGQRNLNYDLAEALRDTKGVMSEIVASTKSSGTHELRVPVRITYSDKRGQSFSDDWELYQQSRWEEANDRISHESLIVRFVPPTSSNSN
jgi:hypothetical protein